VEDHFSPEVKQVTQERQGERPHPHRQTWLRAARAVSRAGLKAEWVKRLAKRLTKIEGRASSGGERQPDAPFARRPRSPRFV
jgi:hypothetical protein